MAIGGTVTINCYEVQELTVLSVFNLTLSDLTITGCGVVTFGTTSNLTLSDLTITYCGSIFFEGPFNSLTLSDLTITGCGSVEFVGPFNLTLSDSDLTITNCGSVTFYGRGLFNLTLSDLAITGCGSVLFHNIEPLLHIRNCEFNWLTLQYDLLSTRVIIENTRVTQLNVTDFPIRIQRYRGNEFVFRNVTFVYSAINGYNPWITPQALIMVHNASNINFVNCSFTGNAKYAYKVLPVGSVVSLAKAHNINFTECTFYNNGITALSAYDSTFLFEGTNKFINNSAYKGGALALFGNSYIEVVPSSGSNVIFQNNVARDVGGAIYIDGTYLSHGPIYGVIPFSKCFLKFDLTKAGNCSKNNCSCLINSFNTTFSFINNTAQSGGNSIYGASFDECFVSAEPYCSGLDLLRLLNVDPGRNTSDLSSVASDPLRACVCLDRKPNCSHSVIISYGPSIPAVPQKVFPGESFQLPVAIVGDRFGTVAGSVHAQLLPVAKGHVARLGELQQMQQVGNECTNITYTISTSDRIATLVLTASVAAVTSYPGEGEIIEIYNEEGCQIGWGIGELLRTFPVFINITIKTCPSGFVHSKETLTCTCDPQLRKYDIGCNLATRKFQRSGTVWLSEEGNMLTVNGHCPRGYCKPEQFDVTPENPDVQCSLNHSGILCGGCQANLSRALGSDLCLSCSNEYLTLLIPFAVAGFALVFFLKLLNLTVAQGTLNGLIFYANIVKANREAWLPAMSPNVLTIFISWLNLDLGIETCFFHGLDAYRKVWLQFVFPIYIWVIMLMIIILSRYFQSLARIIGGNSVPVLATLFLLSYSKLLHTIIALFQLSPLQIVSIDSFEVQKTKNVWSYDGTVPYDGSHLGLLFFVAGLFLVLFCLPYTTTLLFGQCFQKIGFINVMNTLKPFFDAYYGPFKDKHRYWVGLMLLIRGVLFTVFSATPTDMSNVDLLATAVIAYCLLIFLNIGWVYKKNYLNLLENSFLLNLGVFAVGTLYISASGTENQTLLVNILVGIAFVQFIAIVTFHVCTSLRETKIAQWLLPARFLPNQQQQIQIDRAQYERIPPEPDARDGVRPLVMSYNEYREPVLKYQDT